MEDKRIEFVISVAQRISAARRMIVAETRGTGVMCITRTAVLREDTAESPGITTWRQSEYFLTRNSISVHS